MRSCCATHCDNFIPTSTVKIRFGPFCIKKTSQNVVRPFAHVNFRGEIVYFG